MNHRLSRQPRCVPAPPAGFTLIELMVALVLGSLLVVGILAVFIYGNRSYRQDDQVAKMQDELRYAMSQITRDLEMAGYWAGLLDPAEVILHTDLILPPGADCGPAQAVVAGDPPGAAAWLYGNLSALDFVSNAMPSDAAGAFPCLIADELATSAPDVIAVKRLASELSYEVATDETDLVGDADKRPEEMVAGYVYVRTNNSAGTMFTFANINPDMTLDPPYQYWRYRPTIYYVRNYTDRPGDGVPSLCRKVLAPSLTSPDSTQCLATGVEDIQFEFGIDGNGDAAPDFYTATPTPADLDVAVAVRVTLLARSERRGEGYTNQKSYVLSADRTVTPNDRFYRRTLSTTVLLRNPAALRTY